MKFRRVETEDYLNGNVEGVNFHLANWKSQPERIPFLYVGIQRPNQVNLH
ncbi:hypothetical protein UZ717_05635 [Lactiplantibacillus plantarum]|nr:hypothetical protein [Lactiplantibacillus plantarum]MDY8144779.1 hypothetical protein [Lactiplantibacillus plantarum]